LASAPTSAQIALFSSPAAAASTIRARRAVAWPVLWVRAGDANSRRMAARSAIDTQRNRHCGLAHHRALTTARMIVGILRSGH